MTDVRHPQTDAGVHTLEDMGRRIAALEASLAGRDARIARETKADRVCLVCFSGEWDKLFAAFTLANGALALGQEVHLFFTFWAVSALRKETAAAPGREGRSLIQRMMGWMLPRGPAGAPLSRMNFMGLSKRMMRKLMRQQGVDDIQDLMRHAKELGVHLHLCETSAGLFGFTCKDLEDGDSLNPCGVATFLSFALQSRIVLFI